MPGFYINSIPSRVALKNLYPQRCIMETLSEGTITIKRHTLNKFMRDKAFCDTSELAAVTEGVILNLHELLDEYGTATINELVQAMYRKEGEQFFSRFVGPFAGALYDKKLNVWLVWTNHVGDKAVFYSASSKLFTAGSQVNYVIDAFREKGVELSFDEQAAYQMLTFGFMEGDRTYAQEIKRLRGGQYIRYSDGKLEVKEYFTLHHHPERFAGKCDEEIIEELDMAIRHASAQEYAKDEEYGYEHFSDLSGGLDARMNMWVAHSLRPRHIQFMTYCKANYLDEIIAKQLAMYWHDEIIVKPLDDVSYLYEIDDIVFMNAGLSLYSGITGGKRMLEHVNMDVYGLEHTGQLNGGIIGTYLSAIGGGKQPTGMYSEKLKDRLKETNHEEFDDHELYMLYTRGFHGVMNTQMIRSNYTEAWTTTTHPEVMQLCMDVPVEKRLNHALYKKWIISHYPEAAKYKWEKTNSLITDNEYVIKLRSFIRRARNKAGRVIHNTQYSREGMNPLEYWVANNTDIGNFLDRYATSGYFDLPANTSTKLITDMQSLYETGSISEKAMVLTVLASAKLYFGESSHGESSIES